MHVTHAASIAAVLVWLHTAQAATLLQETISIGSAYQQSATLATVGWYDVLWNCRAVAFTTLLVLYMKIRLPGT